MFSVLAQPPFLAYSDPAFRLYLNLLPSNFLKIKEVIDFMS